MMNKKKLFLTVTAIAIVLSVVILPAIAYFTAHTEAKGSVAFALGYKTKISEEINGTTKTVVVENEEGSSEECYVRVIIHTTGAVSYECSGTGWSESGDYWVYSGILAPGGKTSELTVDITPPKGAQAGDRFNVAVVYESTKVEYNADGSAKAPDWSMAAVIDNGGGN